MYSGVNLREISETTVPRKSEPAKGICILTAGQEEAVKAPAPCNRPSKRTQGESLSSAYPHHWPSALCRAQYGREGTSHGPPHQFAWCTRRGYGDVQPTSNLRTPQPEAPLGERRDGGSLPSLTLGALGQPGGLMHHCCGSWTGSGGNDLWFSGDPSVQKCLKALDKFPSNSC